MTQQDEILVRALVHDAHVRLLGANSGDVGLDGDLNVLRKVIGVAEKLCEGTATDEDRESVPEIVHPQVRSLYLTG